MSGNGGGGSEPSAGTSGGGASHGGGGSTNQAGESVTGGGGSSGASGAAGSAGASSGSGGGGGGGEGSVETAASIDDMEDGNAQIAFADGRNGYWYTGADDTSGGTLEPAKDAFAMLELPVDDHGASTYAAHMKAGGHTDWGSVLGCNFIEVATKVKAYDGSQFCGVTFAGKAATAVSVRFSVPDVDTHPEGNVCKLSGAANTLCYDHFTTTFAFTTAWKTFTAKFADLAQVGSGYHPADGKFKSAEIFSLEWALSGTPKTLEIFVDDVQFTPCP